MIDIIYYFNISCCFTMGLLLLSIRTAPDLEDKHYRVVKRFLGAASIIVAVGNTAILLSGGSDLKVEMFSAPLLIVSQLQAALFTFAVLTLFHSQKVKRSYILKKLLPTFVFVLLYTLSVLLFSDVKTHSAEEHLSNLTNPSLLLRTIYGVVYPVQIAIYVRLFRRERKLYMARIENYFADTDNYNLNWATRLFYEATAIGLVVFVFSIFPHQTFDAVLTVLVTYFYLVFALRYVNYQYFFCNTIRAVKNATEESSEAEKSPLPPKAME